MVHRWIAACAAIAAADCMVVASAFASPGDLLHPAGGAVTAQVAAAAQEAAPDDDGEDRTRRGVRAGLRSRLLRLPFAVRAALLLPAYLLGSVVSAALRFGFGWLLRFALLTALFALLWRAVFPQRRLREFFCRRNLLALAAGSLLLSVADRLLPRLWPDYILLRAGAAALLELLVLFAVWFVVLERRRLDGYPVRRLLGGRGGLALLLALAGAVLLRFGLVLLTHDTFWRFLPETVPFCTLAFLFCLLAWRRGRSKSRRTPARAAAFRLSGG